MVTKTTNRLPFADLNAKRFEDLCLGLVLPLARWQDLRHYGRAGSDGGIDILGSERLEGNRLRRWFIQCKCEQKFSAAKLKKVVDEALASAVPDVVLVMVTADISRKAHETFVEYAGRKGISQAFIWSRSLIEARLYSERRDLLYLYFGIANFEETRARETAVTRNIALKKRMRDDFLTPVGSRKRGGPPNPNFRFNDLIVRSIDDSKYPEGDFDAPVISGWFKVEPYDFYYNGIEVILDIRRGLRSNTGRWGVPKYGDALPTLDGFVELNMFLLGRIPYSNIVDYDMLGDEYNPQPHLFAIFGNGGRPYESLVYAATDQPYINTLEPESQVDLTTGKLLRGAG